VPTTTYTPDLRAKISSLTKVPPTQACIFTFEYSPIYWITYAICYDNSLVGATTKAWHLSTDVSIIYRIPIAKVAVFPVPDYA